MQFIDIMALGAYLRYNKLNNVKVYGKVVGSTSIENYMRGDVQVASGSFFAKVQVYAICFAIDKLASDISTEGSKLVPKIQKWHYLLGEIGAVLTDYWYGYKRLIELSGTLYRSKLDNSRFHMSNFSKQNGIWVVKPVSSSIKEDIKAPEPFLSTFIEGASKSTFEYPVRIPAQLQELGKHTDKLRVPSIGKQDAGGSEDGENISSLLSDAGVDLGMQESMYSDSVGAIPTISINESCTSKPEEKAVSVSKKVVYNRQTMLDKFDEYDDMQNLCSRSVTKKNEYVDAVVALAPEQDLGKHIKYMAEAIVENWSHKPESGLGWTGKAIFTDAFKSVYKQRNANSVLEDCNVDLVSYWGMLTDEIPFGDEKVRCALDLYRKHIYLRIVEKILHIKANLLEVVNYFEAYFEMPFLNMLMYDPYMLGILSTRISLKDMDKLAACFGHLFDRTKSREIAVMHEFMMNGSSTVVKNSSCVLKKSVCSNIVFGYEFSAREYEAILAHKNELFSSDIQTNIFAYISPLFTSDYCKFQDKSKWRSAGRQHYRYPMNVSTDEGIFEYLTSGVGVEFNINGREYLADLVFFEMEMDIFNRLMDLNQNKVQVGSEEAFQKVISDFEALKAKEFGLAEFKLEELQKNAIHLVGNPVACVTGPAGSGKTTVAEGIVYAFESVLGISRKEIKFAAPTGKAADRLKECTKQSTATIHSLCMAGVGNDADTPKYDYKKLKCRALIVDETFMVSLELMHTLVMSIPDDCMVIFLGDIEQLPPIDCGKPFASLLRFVPCVTLNISKRAEENSFVSKACDALINHSDDASVKDLVSGEDFQLLQLVGDQKDRIQDVVRDICLYHLGNRSVNLECSPIKDIPNLSADDIQVVTPVKKDTFRWGSIALNNTLHDIFNPVTNQFVVSLKNPKNIETKQFREGDRVIHTVNWNDATRYVKNEGTGVYAVSDYGQGIRNGSMGKIVRIVQSDEVVVEGMSSGGNSRKYLIIVQYSDYADVNGEVERVNFFIFYEFNKSADVTDKLVETKDFLSELDLAYALTTHKMQGSQAKLIICVVYNVGYNSTFISRNMMYTMISRASKGVYFIGDVLGMNSVVARGRKINESRLRISLLDLASFHEKSEEADKQQFDLNLS